MCRELWNEARMWVVVHINVFDKRGFKALHSREQGGRSGPVSSGEVKGAVWQALSNLSVRTYLGTWVHGYKSTRIHLDHVLPGST